MMMSVVLFAMISTSLAFAPCPVVDTVACPDGELVWCPPPATAAGAPPPCPTPPVCVPNPTACPTGQVQCVNPTPIGAPVPCPPPPPFCIAQELCQGGLFTA